MRPVFSKKDRPSSFRHPNFTLGYQGLYSWVPRTLLLGPKNFTLGSQELYSSAPRILLLGTHIFSFGVKVFFSLIKSFLKGERGHLRALVSS